MPLSAIFASAETASSAAASGAGERSRGLAQGGLGGAEDELLESGQEEVFSRTEVESGVIEHHSGEHASSHGKTHADVAAPSADTV